MNLPSHSSAWVLFSPNCSLVKTHVTTQKSSCLCIIINSSLVFLKSVVHFDELLNKCVPGHPSLEDQALLHAGRSAGAGAGGSEQLLHGHMELTRRVSSVRTPERRGGEEAGLPLEASPTPARMFCVC